ncbi:fimbrial protein [Klebsiella aerogenes]|uniref:fimbrial protein n=1 Tax=Klebsiella aerogenes TaxID=548 RepID=UPI0037989F11
MTPSLLSRCAISTLLTLWAAHGTAHDGTVNVTGRIVDKTCVVSADSTTQLVTFGNVSSKTFSRSGEGSRYEPFTINLEKCGAGASNVSVTFSGNADGRNPALLALTPAPGSATGMAIALYDSKKNQLPLSQAGGSTDLSPAQASVALLFYARYLANGEPVSSGTANASATFMLTYA